MAFRKIVHEDGREEFINENYDALTAAAEAEEVSPHVITEEEEKSFYRVRRSNEYPMIGEQLDKLFHDIDEGKLDKTGEFYKAIKDVKDTFPKS